MAALPAEAEGWRQLLRAVTRLQACVRGYLLRKRFRSLRAEYEEVVREIEGDLSRLRWRGRFLPRPVFLPEPAQEECSGPPEASTEKAQEELGTAEPEQDGGCSDVEPSAQLQNERDLSSGAEGNAVSPPNPGADASTAEGHSAPAESQDWQELSSITSVWDSTALEPEALGDCLEIPPEDIKELPRTRSGLQAYRNHLLMELLWLQQAIASRENYLMLKQGLGTPDP
ncbi:IQ domain-containing protein C [Pogoniulus pusillus]|uniref:IQ domain-containing protein C n=1 Tax=Pogoniulus pusillus TaxID=488313 RepID=UPI0030B97554